MTALRLLIVPWLVLPIAMTTGCTAECPEPAYGGKASDESYRTMVDARDDAIEDETSSPVITTPESDAVLDAAGDAPVFAWTSSLNASLGPSPLPGPAMRPRGPSLIDIISDVVIPKAYAHLPPVTGDVYLLEVTWPERECPVAGHTTDLEWELDKDSWDALKEWRGGEEDLTLTITSAYLNENRVSEGPFKSSAPTKFRLSE